MPCRHKTSVIHTSDTDPHRPATAPEVPAPRVSWSREQNEPVATIEVREGTFTGGLPYLVVGSGEPLVYLCGFTLDHRNPRQGYECKRPLWTPRQRGQGGFSEYLQ